MPKVIVGMSGGVDSAVTAYLLKMAGYDVIGVTLRTWLTSEGKDSRCCEIDDAQKVAWKLGIPYYVTDSRCEFNDLVIKPFIDSYINGMTPNPCVECNRYIKWEKMLATADTYGAEYIATGHYASVVKLDNGRYTVKQAEHIAKDQTYMVYKLTQEQLSRTLMPLGKLSKDEVRDIAIKAGLPVADKPDSQEICFVPDGHYSEYIVVFNVDKCPDWITPDFVCGKKPFVDALIHSGAMNLTDLKQTKGFDWTWLTSIVTIEDIIEENGYSGG